LTVVITALLYVTQLEREADFFYHLDIIFLELYFIPVVLACLWKGLAGGLATSLGVTLMLLPYLVVNWDGLSPADLDRMLSIAVYFIGSVILGKVIAGQKKDQERAKDAESLAAIGKSMAMVAHDMKTPLVSIGGFSRLVLRHLDQNFPHRDKLEIVIQETARLDSMVRDMLAFSKPLELNLARENIGELVKETLAMAEAVSSKRGVKLRCELSERLQSVSLDAVRMKQVLVNLVTNAIEASPEGETVTVKAHIKKRNLQIEVMDCGCGIPLEKRQEVFLPFFTTKKGGVGLGLDITKKIVESHGGSIEILDNKRKGLVFKVTIPA
jgi:signal transduction histidine kinase